MIGRYTLSFASETNKESSISFEPIHLVNTSFLPDKFCILTWQAELRVCPTVAPYFANFNVGNVIVFICHSNLRTLSNLLYKSECWLKRGHSFLWNYFRFIISRGLSQKKQLRTGVKTLKNSLAVRAFYVACDYFCRYPLSISLARNMYLTSG